MSKEGYMEAWTNISPSFFFDCKEAESYKADTTTDRRFQVQAADEFLQLVVYLLTGMWSGHVSFQSKLQWSQLLNAFCIFFFFSCFLLITQNKKQLFLVKHNTFL